MSYVTEAYRGQLSTLHGKTLTVALMDPTYVGGPDDTNLSTVSGEITAPGYSRQTVTGVWEPEDGTLTWDAPPSFDADGAPEIQTALVADDTGQIVAGLTWSEPIAGTDPLELDAPYIASVADEAGVLGRLDDLDTRVAVLESAPGGGVVEIIAGANITVNNADPTKPIVSATSGGGGGGGTLAGMVVSTGSPSATADLTGIDPSDTTALVYVPDSGVTDLTVALPDPETQHTAPTLAVAVLVESQEALDFYGDALPMPLLAGVAVGGVSFARFDLGDTIMWLPAGAWGVGS